MIGIIIAMERELAPYLKDAPYTEAGYKGKKFYSLKIGGQGVVICFAGVGKVNAAYSATLMIEKYSPEFIINTGTSGGLGESGIFDIIIADKLVQHDCDTTALGDPPGLAGMPVGKIYFETDKKLSDMFFTEIKNAKRGVLASGDVFVADKTRAKEIVHNFNAVACDMESGAVAQVCYLAGVPVVVIRGVSDIAGGENSFYEMLDRVSVIIYSAVYGVIAKL